MLLVAQVPLPHPTCQSREGGVCIYEFMLGEMSPWVSSLLLLVCLYFI